MLGADPRRARLRIVTAVSAALILMGGVAGPLGWPIGGALAQTAEGGGIATLEGVTFDLGFAKYRVPRLELTGASLNRDELLKIFDASEGGPLAPRLKRLSAKRLAAPEVVVEQQIGAERQVTRYRDVELRDVVEGRVSSMTAAGATIEITSPKGGSVSGMVGRLAISGLDMAEAARIYEERASAIGELKTIYSAFSLDGLYLRSSEGAEIRIQRIAGQDFLARPTKGSWAEIIKTLGAVEVDNASPSDRASVVAALAELMDSFSVGLTEVVGVEIRDPKDKNQATIRIARMAYAGESAGRPADARMEGVEVLAKNGSARIGSIVFTGFSFRSTIGGLRELAARPIEEADLGTLRKLMPTIGTVRISGIDFDVPNEKSAAPEPENIKFTVKGIEATAENPVNGIPTSVRIGTNGFSFQIPAGTKEDGLRDLVAMGYSRLDLSWLIALTWSEPGNELLVREVSLSSADMGSLSLRGVLGGVTRDVFNTDSAVAMVALLGATVKSADLTVENRGLFEKVLAREAARQKKSADDLRREYGMAAAVAVPALLGNSAQAKAIGQAVARFVAKPVKLAISAKTKDPAGLGLGDFVALDQPSALLQKLDVTVQGE